MAERTGITADVPVGWKRCPECGASHGGWHIDPATAAPFESDRCSAHVELPSARADDAWPRIDAELRAAVTDVTYHVWLSDLDFAGEAFGTLYVRAGDHCRTWVAARFARLIAKSARRVLERDVEVVVVDERFTIDRAAPTETALERDPDAVADELRRRGMLSEAA